MAPGDCVKLRESIHFPALVLHGERLEAQQGSESTFQPSQKHQKQPGHCGWEHKTKPGVTPHRDGSLPVPAVGGARGDVLLAHLIIFSSLGAGG